MGSCLPRCFDPARQRCLATSAVARAPASANSVAPIMSASSQARNVMAAHPRRRQILPIAARCAGPGSLEKVNSEADAFRKYSLTPYRGTRCRLFLRIRRHAPTKRIRTSGGDSLGHCSPREKLRRNGEAPLGICNRWRAEPLGRPRLRRTGGVQRPRGTGLATHPSDQLQRPGDGCWKTRSCAGSCASSARSWRGCASTPRRRPSPWLPWSGRSTIYLMSWAAHKSGNRSGVSGNLQKNHGRLPPAASRPRCRAGSYLRLFLLTEDS